MKIKKKTFEDYCPYCDICGERITDDTFFSTGKWKFHRDCLDEESTDTYVENERMREDVYTGEY